MNQLYDAELWAELRGLEMITDDMQRLYEAFDRERSSYGNYEPAVRLDTRTLVLSVVGTFEDREYQIEIRWAIREVPTGEVEGDSRWYRKVYRLSDFSLQKHVRILDVDHSTVDDQWSDELWFRSPAKVARAVLLGEDDGLKRRTLARLDRFESYVPAKDDQWTACDDQEWRVVLTRQPLPEVAMAPPTVPGVRRRRHVRDDRPRTAWDERVIYASLAEAEVAATMPVHEHETLVIETHRIVQRVTATGEASLAWFDGHECYEPWSAWVPVDEEARLWVAAMPDEPVAEPEPEIPLSKVKLPTKSFPPGGYWRWEHGTFVVVRQDAAGWRVLTVAGWGEGRKTWDEIDALLVDSGIESPTKRAALEAAHVKFA